MLKRSLISLSVALACMSAHATSYYMLTPIANASTQQGAGTQPDIAVSLTSYALPSGQVGVPYTGFDFKPLLFVTGDAAYSGTGASWSVASGTIPAGLTLNANGTLSGTPTTAGNSSFEIKASYKTKTGKQAYQVAVVSVNVALATATPSSAQVGIAYQYDLKPLLTVTGDENFNANNVTWSVVNSTLPAGLSLRTDGTISGTPTAAGTGTVTARATYLNAQGEQTYQVVSHEITVSLASATVPQGMVGQAFNYDVKPLLSVKTDGVTTANATPTWSVSAGTLPAGLTLNTDGTITGTPTAASNSNVTLRATYSGINGEQTYQIIALNVTVTLATATPTSGVVGVMYQYDLNPLVSVAGDTAYPGHGGGVSWSLLNGTLPTGLTLNADGTITGTPSTEGDYPVAIQASYKNKSGSQSYSFAVGANDPYWNNVSLLLHLDGASGSTQLVDGTGKSIIPLGGLKLDSFAKFGASSAKFSTKTDAIQLPTSTGFSFSGDFTIEAWVNPTQLHSGAWGVMDFRSSGATSAQYVVGLENKTGVYRPNMFFGTGLGFTGTSTSIPLNAWSHVAFVRKNGVISFYVNGVKDVTTFNYAAAINSGTNPIIGAKDSNLAPYGTVGYMDDIRITNGVARYTSNFTLPSASFPNQ